MIGSMPGAEKRFIACLRLERETAATEGAPERVRVAGGDVAAPRPCMRMTMYATQIRARVVARLLHRCCGPISCIAAHLRDGRPRRADRQSGWPEPVELVGSVDHSAVDHGQHRGQVLDVVFADRE